MNLKFKKVLTYLAAAVFVLALAINVKVTLDDPFMMISDEAIATTTGGSGTGSLWVIEYGEDIGSQVNN